MIRSLRYKETHGKFHHYALIDSNFATLSVVSSDSEDYVNTLFDEMAVIVKEYSAPSRQLPVAPNIATHLYNKYCISYSLTYSIKRFNELLDQMCKHTITYYPYADINSYKPCIKRQFDRLLWAQKNFKR